MPSAVPSLNAATLSRLYKVYTEKKSLFWWKSCHCPHFTLSPPSPHAATSWQPPSYTDLWSQLQLLFDFQHLSCCKPFSLLLSFLPWKCHPYSNPPKFWEDPNTFLLFLTFLQNALMIHSPFETFPLSFLSTGNVILLCHKFLFCFQREDQSFIF